MQKSYETNTENNVRSKAVRAGAIALALVTLFGMTEMGRRAQLRAEAIIPHDMAAVFSHTLEKENETTRMPVRFDDGLRAPTIGGI
jgi:hypothetical protein